MENTNATFLPNPELKRLPIVKKCVGCDKIFTHVLPEGLVDICICYEDAETKWRNYRLEVGTKKKGGKEEEVLYHYNPCPMATHIKHSPKVAEIRGRVKRK